MSDWISRQAAIDAVSDLYWMDERLLNFRKEIDAVFDKIKELPSAEPEPLTDKEQRIFLAAMGREYKICKKADEEYYGIDNINLVKVCREIERKVKKALWTS